MKSNYSLILFLALSIVGLCSYFEVSAEEDDIISQQESTISQAESHVVNNPDGSIVKYFTTPGTTNIAGTITTSEGTVNFTSITDSLDGSRTVKTLNETIVFDADGNIISGASTPILGSIQGALNQGQGGGPIVIFTTEMIPGVTCNCVAGGTSTPGVCPSNIAITQRKYQCTIEPGLSSFQSMFAGIIRYLIYIVLLLGVLAIAGLGVAWGWTSGDDAKMKSALKKWGANILAGLIILFLFQYILRFIAPWIYQ